MFRPLIQSLRRHPSANAAIIITLSLALASTVLVAGLINTVLVSPLPQIEDRNVMMIREYDLDLSSITRNRASWDTALDIRRESTSFSRIAVATNASFTLHGNDSTEVAYIPRVSPEFFGIFKVTPALGSIITPLNAQIDGQPGLMLGYSLWQRRFGGDPQVIGRSVQLDDSSATVVGVLPPDFELFFMGAGQQAWVAMDPESFALSDRGSRRHFVIGELAPDVDPRTANAELGRLGTVLQREFPATNHDRGISAAPLRDAIVGPFQRQLWILLATSALVLVVACLNSGALLLAQALRRRREFAVRLAIGARPARLLRLFWAENLALTLIAAVISLAIAAWVGPLLMSLLPTTTGVRAFASPDIGLTSWSVALSAACLVALVFGLMPWTIARHLSIEETLRGGGRTVAAGVAGRFSRWLVTGQIAVALSIAVGAALLVVSSNRLSHVDYGFPVEELYQFRIGTRGPLSTDDEARVRFFNDVQRELTQLPGVTAVSLATFSYPNPPSNYRSFVQEGDDFSLMETPKQAQLESVTPSFFATHDVGIIHGRAFEETDRIGHPFVAAVSASLAERYWPNSDALGKRIRVGPFPDQWLTIVGVVSDRLSNGLNPIVVDHFLIPFAQVPQPSAAVFVRYAGASPPAFSTLQRTVWGLDPDVSIFFESHVGEFHRNSQWQHRFSMILIGVFALLAIVLCAGGLYAVLAFTVAARVREFGVRAALGASAADIHRQVLFDASKMIIPGLALGLLLATATGRGLGSLLFDVPPLSLSIFLSTGITLAAVCVVAAWIPARRATKIDPSEALRSE